MLLVLVSACAQQSDDKVSAGDAPAGPPRLATLRVAPPPGDARLQAPKGAIAVNAAKVDAALLPADYPRQVWTLHKGETLAAYGQRGGCGRVRLEVAARDAKRVKLRFVQKVPEPKKVCTLELHQVPLTTSLDKPLGDREVVLDAVKRRG